MRKTKNYLTDVTVIKGEGETPVKIKLKYEEMPNTFGNLVDAFWETIVVLDKVCVAMEYIYGIKTSDEYKKEYRKTLRAFSKWVRHAHFDKYTSAGVFRSKMVTASVVWRKRFITITICETAKMKFKVELYKKGEECN